MRKKVMIVLGIILIPLLIYSQQPVNGKIEGIVVDENKQPVPYATVMLLKALDSTLVKGELSDVNGKYFFERIPVGKYTIRVTNVGYTKTTSSEFAITATDNVIMMPTFEISPGVKQLKEVTVTAQRPFVEQRIDRTIVNVQNSIISAGTNALEILERAPGVVIDQNDKISLRGKWGVIIMIDGRQSYLSSADVANLLRNMQSNGIETIELITNPSAKYDAAGNAGIIDIRMKKNKTMGTNGSFTAGVGYGRFEKGIAGFSLNHRNGRWNLFSTYNANYSRRFMNSNFNRTVDFNGSETILDQHNYRPATTAGHNFKAGADFSLTKRKIVGFMVNGNFNDNDIDVDSYTNITDGDLNLLSRLKTTNDMQSGMRNLSGNLNYIAQLDSGRELSASLDMSRFNGYRNEFFQSREYDSGDALTDELILRSDIPTNVEIKVAKVDYVHPFNKKTKFEAGAKSSFISTNNNVRFDSLSEGAWYVSNERTNHFIYEENINAAYVNYSKQMNQIGVQLGLRAEHTVSKGESITLDSVVSREYLNIFPSVFVSHKVSKAHSVNYSYSRRIDRPSYQDLNPFIYYIDKYTYSKGNPWLQPQYTNAFSITHNYKGYINTSIGYSHTTNLFTQVPKQNDETKVTYATQQNINTLDNFNLNFSITNSFTKAWTANSNLSVFHNRVTGYYEGSTVNNSMTSLSFNTAHKIRLSEKYTAEINGMYMSPQVDGFRRYQSRYAIGAGVQKIFWEKRATLKLTVTDIFWTLRGYGSLKVDNVDLRVRQRAETRVARLTFSYRFGKTDVKQPRKKAPGSEAEESRVGDSN